MARRKTVTVEVTKPEAYAILEKTKEYLGGIVAEYDEQESLRFLIDDAKAKVAKWQAVFDSLN